MKVRFPAALAVFAIGVSCAAVLAALYGGGWFRDIEAEGEIQPTVKKMEPSVPAAAVQIIEVEKLEIDFEGRRVRLPGEGWISVPEFWDIYYNNPQKLQGEIDFAKLDQLKNLPDPELSEGNGDPPQQPDTSDQTPDSALDPSLNPSLDPVPDPALDPTRDPTRDPVWDPAREPGADPA